MRITEVNEEIVRNLRDSGLSQEMGSLEFCDFLVIEEMDGTIIGAGGLGGLFNVPSLQISKEFQGKGIGKILLDATINEAKRRGVSFISGSRNPENVRAIKLHDHFGFHPIFRVHYSPGLTRDIIILVLKPRGKLIEKIFYIFNTLPGSIILSIMLKIVKPLFGSIFTLPPKEFPDPDLCYIMKNFEKLPNRSKT